MHISDVHMMCNRLSVAHRMHIFDMGVQPGGDRIAAMCIRCKVVRRGRGTEPSASRVAVFGDISLWSLHIKLESSLESGKEKDGRRSESRGKSQIC
jgi:hypothetical protein